MSELLEKDYTIFKNYCFDENVIIPNGFKYRIYHTKEQRKIMNNICIMCEKYDKNKQFICDMCEKYDKNKQLVVDYLLLSELKEHTILLFQDNKGYKEGLASCVYLQYKGEKYLFSAGHTFIDELKKYKETNEFDSNKFKLFLSDKSNIYLKDCHTFIILPSEDETDFHQLDYMFIFVDDDLSAELSKHGFFPCLISDNVLSDKIAYPLFNFLYGFPSKKNKDSKWKRLSGTNPYCLDVSFKMELLEYSTVQEVSEKNKGIDFKVNNINSFSKRVYPSEHLTWKNFIPDLHGMSGCGVWGVKSYPHYKGECLLEGIFIGVDKDNKNFINLKIQDAIANLEESKQKFPNWLKEKGFYFVGKKKADASDKMKKQS